MRKDDIKVGQDYYVKNNYGRGKARVLAEAERHNTYYGGHAYTFPVLFPDARPGQRIEARVSPRDFLREWSEDDQEVFNANRYKEAQERAVRDALLAAGFQIESVRIHDRRGEMRLYLTFVDCTEKAVAALLAGAEISQPGTLTELTEKVESS